jgi:hypothetical protein
MRDLERYDDDYKPRQAAGSVEPFQKPDYRAKKHPKPIRRKHARRCVKLRFEDMREEA